MIRLVLALAALLFAQQAAAAPITVSSPGGVLTVSVDVNGEGRPEYSVSRRGSPVILPSRLGFLLTAAAIVLAASLTFGARWRLAVPLAIAAPLLVHLVFYKLLRVPLPAGLLSAPWAAA